MRSHWRASVSALPYVFSRAEFRKEFTENYPDPISSITSEDLPTRSKGFLVNNANQCTGCRECEKVCPVKCIELALDKVPEGSKPWVADFRIDHSRCVFCGLCVEVCPPQSLKHSREFEGATTRIEDLVTQDGKGWKDGRLL